VRRGGTRARSKGQVRPVLGGATLKIESVSFGPGEKGSCGVEESEQWNPRRPSGVRIPFPAPFCLLVMRRKLPRLLQGDGSVRSSAPKLPGRPTRSHSRTRVSRGPHGSPDLRDHPEQEWVTLSLCQKQKARCHLPVFSHQRSRRSKDQGASSVLVGPAGVGVGIAILSNLGLLKSCAISPSSLFSGIPRLRHPTGHTSFHMRLRRRRSARF